MSDLRQCVRRFDAQVHGAMTGAPRFRKVFGYMFERGLVLPANLQSAVNSISGVGSFLVSGSSSVHFPLHVSKSSG